MSKKLNRKQLSKLSDEELIEYAADVNVNVTEVDDRDALIDAVIAAQSPGEQPGGPITTKDVPTKGAKPKAEKKAPPKEKAEPKAEKPAAPKKQPEDLDRKVPLAQKVAAKCTFGKYKWSGMSTQMVPKRIALDMLNRFPGRFRITE